MTSSDQPKRGGLSLYANLLDPNSSTPGSVSSAPVTYKQPDQTREEEAAAKKQVNAAALRFQPTRRPQAANQKPKPKATAASRLQPSATSSSSPSAAIIASSDDAKPVDVAPAPIRSTLADWTNDDDDVNGFYGEKRERGGRKKKNRKRREAEQVVQDWDDIYDPSRPNNYEEYKHSDERIREIRDWKDKLYAHRIKRRRTSDLSSDEEDAQRGRPAAFAPPSAYNFAPPSDEPPPDTSPAQRTSPPPPASLNKQETAEEVYARRIRMSQPASQLPPTAPVDTDVPALPQPPSDEKTQEPETPMSRPVPAAFAAIQSAAVSRAPVRYSLPAAPADIPASQAELEKLLDQELQEEADHSPGPPAGASDETSGPRSNRPGQAKFAERMMAKMGWTKGSGLGANGEGITTALKVKLEKRKQKSDAEGGGFIGPGGKGTIVGGKKKPGTDDVGKFGAMSEVVVLHGILGGMDVDKEIRDGLIQEIGQECGEKYGNVERIFVYRDSDAASPPVFVKFVQPLSALRAVNALDGRVFNGNTIRAAFWDADKFEQGTYG